MALIRGAGMVLALCLLALVGVLSIQRRAEVEVGWIAFAQWENYQANVYLAKVGGEKTRLISTDIMLHEATMPTNTNPQWSRQGDKFAFLKYYPLEICVFQIANFQTTCRYAKVDNRHPTPTDDNIGENGFRWSADGQWLILASERKLYRLHPDEFTLEPITEGARWIILPQSDSPHALFIESDAAIYEMDVDGANPHLLFKSDQYLNYVRFSPDGQWLLFNYPQDYEGLHVMQADGTHQRRFTLPPDQYLEWIGWSPRNQLTYHDLSWTLHLIDPITTAPRQVALDYLPTQDIQEVVWAREKDHLLVTAFLGSGKGYGVYRVNVTDQTFDLLYESRFAIQPLGEADPINLDWHRNRLFGGAVVLLALVLFSWGRRMLWR